MNERIKKRIPFMLSCIAALGTIGTAVAAAKDTTKAQKILDKDKNKKHTKKEVVVMTWKCYIPTITICTSTLICIFGANALNQKQQASLASAYALLANYHKQYKDTLIDLYGEEAHEEIVNSIVTEKAKDAHLYSVGMLSTSSLEFGDLKNPETQRIFYDAFSERYFESTIERVIQAEYHLNRNFVLGLSLTLNDFYEFLGLTKVEGGDCIGWSMQDEIYWIDFDHYISTLDDGTEVLVVTTSSVCTPCSEWLEDYF